MKKHRFVCRIVAALLFSFCLSLQMVAEEINALVLHMSSGKQVTCLLDEQPVVTFVSNELVITTHMNKVSYQASDVQKFTYSYVDPNGVKDVNGGGTVFSFVGNTLVAHGLTPSSKVEAYKVDGKLVASATTDKNGNVSLTIPSHSGKVFVVKTSVANFKICKP